MISSSGSDLDGQGWTGTSHCFPVLLNGQPILQLGAERTLVKDGKCNNLSNTSRYQ